MAFHDVDWRAPADEDVIAFVENAYEHGKARRLYWEAEAGLVLAWVRGCQHLILQEWEENTQAPPELAPGFYEGQSEKDRPFYARQVCTVNRIRGALLTLIGLSLSNPITWDVLPASSEDDDVAAARTSAKVLQAYFRMGELIDLFWTVYATGIGFLKLTWDPMAGGSDRVTREHLEAIHRQEAQDEREYGQRASTTQRVIDMLRRVLPGNAGDQLSESYELPRGDISIDYATGWNITEPEGCTLIEKAPWTIDSRWMSIHEGRERWGAAFEDVEPQPKDASWMQYDQAWSDQVDAVAGGAPTQCLVHELWVRTCNQYPAGHWAVVADGKLIRSGPHPYVHGHIPLVTVRAEPDPHRFRPQSAIRNIIGLQNMYNTVNSGAASHFKQTLAPQYFAEKGSGLSDGAFDHNARVIDVDIQTVSGRKVMPVERAPLPPYLFNLLEIIRRDLDDVSGAHPTSRGEPEFSGQSGRHAQIIQGGDARGQAVTRILLQEAFERGGLMLLWLLRQFVTTERVAYLAGGRTATADAIRFKGSHLFGSAPYTQHDARVRCRIRPEQSLAEIDDYVERSVRLGVIDPRTPEGRMQIIEAYGDRYAGVDLDDNSLHLSNAAGENDDFLAGREPAVSPGDHDALHIRQHLRFLAEDRTKGALLRDPQLAERVQKHIATHHYYAAEKEIRPQAIRAVVAQLMAQRYGIGGGAPAGASSAAARPQPTPEAPNPSPTPTGTPQPIRTPPRDGSATGAYPRIAS